MEKKELGYILLAFAGSYIFFGLDEVMSDYSVDIKKIFGWLTILIGLMFIIFAINYLRKKD